MRALLVAALVLVAGCVGAPAEPAPAAIDVAPTLAPGPYALVCPPGGEERGDVCIREIARFDESLQEPFIAAHPTRPGVFAIGVNGGALLSDVGPNPAVATVLLDLFVTEDGGETWTHERIPYVPTAFSLLPVESYGSGDPALAFDENGVLHVSGIASPNPLLQGYDTFYTSSPDLGKTWTTPIAFGADEDNDRNWISVAPGGRVFVPWQNVGVSSQLAWSADAGATWEITSEYADCITVSPVQMAGEEALLACAHYDEAENALTGIEILKLDEGSNALVNVASFDHEGAAWPHLRGLPGGGLVLVFEDFEAETLVFSHSSDAGRTWSIATDVRDLMMLDDGWKRAEFKWGETDPEGGLHLVVGGVSAPLPVPAMQRNSVAYVVLDPIAGTLLSEALLPSDARVPPRTAGPSFGDHYHGIAFQGGEALLVWTQDRVLDVTKLVPAANETA